MTKQELRTAYLSKRQELSPSDIDKFSKAIAENFVTEFNFTGKTIHIYLPIAAKNEPNTRLIIDKIKPNSTLVVSRSNFTTCEMLHIAWENSTCFAQNQYGIEEPTGGILVDPSAIDIVLIPLLACDKKGHRVGYGKGFYDRFLKKCRHKALFVGLSFFEPVDDIVDVHKSDVRLTHCVTPKTVHHFQG